MSTRGQHSEGKTVLISSSQQYDFGSSSVSLCSPISVPQDALVEEDPLRPGHNCSSALRADKLRGVCTACGKGGYFGASGAITAES